MDNQIRRIGILTSGGDAPGMNSAIRAAVRTCCLHNVIPVGIYRGYNGLIYSDVKELTSDSVAGLNSKGGTMLYTARSQEFMTEEGQNRAVTTCRYLGIDGLIAIGGDGTFRGAKVLCAKGVNTVCVPATIDNDIACTSYSIGSDTAANTAIDIIDKLSDTMQSHERCSVVEVMGRHAGYLALYVGMSTGATSILLPEHAFDFETDVVERIRKGKYHGKHHFLIIVAEGVGKTSEIAQRIESEMGIETRVSIIGHVQRGGSPSARDRSMGTRMGHRAVEELIAGNSNLVICYREYKITTVPIEEALQMKKTLDPYMLQVANDTYM